MKTLFALMMGMVGYGIGSVLEQRDRETGHWVDGINDRVCELEEHDRERREALEKKAAE